MNSFFHDALLISLRDEPIVHRTSCSNDASTTNFRRIRQRFFGRPIKVKLKRICRSKPKKRIVKKKSIRTNVSLSLRSNFRLSIEKICPIEREKCRFYQIENPRSITSRTRFGQAILFLQQRKFQRSCFPMEFLLTNRSSSTCRTTIQL